MVRIAPVRLSFNPKTLWFDSAGLDLSVGDDVIVSTARGYEFGTVSNALFDMGEDEQKKLKSPLKSVVRLADDDDREKRCELEHAAAEALPVFKRLAAEIAPDMNPVAVEYLFDGDKAVFYFESEDRIDFRDLVRKLASEFHVRIDMKQIGVRDSARMVGGLGHCGQELCCRRLGGEFNPVSIRMAKEQDLSLNPTKISGICGRLMCCLRYEYDAYKDFHGRAPKKNAKISTPDGEGKVVDLDVPREIVSVKVGDEKPVKVPLADFEPVEGDARPHVIGQEAWDAANEAPSLAIDSGLSLFTNQLTGEDQLAQPGQVRHVYGDEKRAEKPSRSRRRRSSRSESSKEARAAAEAPTTARKPRRRRSTTVAAEGEAQSAAPQQAKPSRAQQVRAQQDEAMQKPVGRRRSRSRSASRADSRQPEAEKKNVQVGRNSSALRSGRSEQGPARKQPSTEAQGQQALDQHKQGASRRRRRSHKTGTQGGE